MFETITLTENQKPLGEISTSDEQGSEWFISPIYYTPTYTDIESTVEFINTEMSDDDYDIRKGYLTRKLDSLPSVSVSSEVSSDTPNIKYSISLDGDGTILDVFYENNITGDVLVRDSGSWVDLNEESTKNFYGENVQLLEYKQGEEFVKEYDTLGKVELSKYFEE